MKTLFLALAKLGSYILMYFGFPIWIAITIYTLSCLITYKLPITRLLGINALKSLIIPILLGSPLEYFINSFDLSLIFSQLFLYIGIPFTHQNKFTPSEIIIIISAILSTSQLPLDWDYGSKYQYYPYPVLISIEVSHSAALFFNILISIL